MMKRIVLCSNDTGSKAEYLQNQTLPDDYMGDYSVMGLVVGDMDDAAALLKAFGYQLEHMGGYAEVIIESFRQLPIIKKNLAAEGIYCEYSDIADTLYQA